MMRFLKSHEHGAWGLLLPGVIAVPWPHQSVGSQHPPHRKLSSSAPDLSEREWNSRRAEMEAERRNHAAISCAPLDKMGPDIWDGQSPSSHYSVTGWENLCRKSCVMFLHPGKVQKRCLKLPTCSSLHSPEEIKSKRAVKPWYLKPQAS